MNRWRALALAFVVVALLASGGGLVVYKLMFRAAAPPVAPEHHDTGAKLPTQTEFDELVKTNPVAALSVCLTKYEREVSGLHCTVEKQERIQGRPKHPELPPVEVLDLRVRGDVPDPNTGKTAIEAVVKWKSGAKSFLRAEITGTLFSERPESEGGLDGKVVTWRPKALISSLSSPIPPNSDLAKSQSRYCIRDAGLYRTMLRTHEAWKKRLEAKEFEYEYLGIQKVEKAGNRECHVIRRICPRVELDSFELGGTASTDPKVVAEEGFTEVTIYIDREHWLQVATETYRTEPDGTKVTVGTYHFRDIDLKPTFAPDTFTVAGLKK